MRVRGEWFRSNKKLLAFIDNAEDFQIQLDKKKHHGAELRYLYYSPGKSRIVIPRMIIEAFSLDWNHRDILNLIHKEIDSNSGLFLTKKGVGHKTRYIFYEKTKKSSVTLPRFLLEANNLEWNQGDIILLILKEIEGKKGIFLYRKETTD